MAGDETEAGRWLAYAQEDLEHGKLGADIFPRSAAWNFQQAAEKALKAMLLAHGKAVPRTHDLPYLLQLVSDPTAPEDELVSAVLTLSEVSVASRYPAELPDITTQDCARFEKAAGEIVAWALRKR